MGQDWDIKSRSEACTACEKPFLDKQEYYATLAFGEEGYARTDFCDDCWTAHKENSQAYSMWKGVFRMPPPPDEEALQKETAESLLRKLMEDDDPDKINVRYILTVMLERKKILIERDVQTGRDGGKIRVYEHRKTGETFVVPDPALRLDELEEVQEEVVIMLGGKVPEGKGSNAAVEAPDLSDPEELRKHADKVLAETGDDPEDDDDDEDDD
jgi:hypothetical protein